MELLFSTSYQITRSMELLFSIESNVNIVAAVVATVGFIAFLYHGHFKSVPPGSFGFPIIGDSISFVRAYKHAKLGEWAQARIDKYGPVFKTSLFGTKTIFITGQAGNKFVFGNSSNGITTKVLPRHAGKLVFGKYSVFDISGPKHEILRSLVTSVFGPGHLKSYVSQIQSIVKHQIFQDINGEDSIKMVPLMKKISFMVSCNLLIGVTERKEKDTLYEDSMLLLEGISSFPINIPGTTYYNALQARSRLCKKLSTVMRRKAEEIENRNSGHNENMVSRLLNLRDENGDYFTEEALQDNLLSLIIASLSPIPSVLCTLIQKLARNSEVYDKVLKEQKEVLNAYKERDGKLTWDEIKMMKYTWRVVQELMRLTPPAQGNFKFAEKDTTFSGFDIPKGSHLFWVASPTHMNEDIFDNPESFDPARFESISSIPPYTYIPFGAGHRICPGAEFARIEVLVVIHHLVINYTWTEMISDEQIACVLVPFPAMGLPVRLSHKEG